MTFWSCRMQTWSWILPKYLYCSNISRTEGGPRSSDRVFKGVGRGDTPLMSYGGNKILTWSANVLFFTHLTDILTCYKVLRSDMAKALNLQCDGFDFDAEVPCRLLRHGYRIIEIPVVYNPRSVDEGKKLTPKAGWSVLRAILRSASRER